MFSNKQRFRLSFVLGNDLRDRWHGGSLPENIAGWKVLYKIETKGALLHVCKGKRTALAVGQKETHKVGAQDGQLPLRLYRALSFG